MNKGINIQSAVLVLALIFTAVNTNALDYPHFSVNNIGCDSCHFIYGTEDSLLLEGLNYGQDIDDTQYNALCWSCHNDIKAPYMRTHSSLQTDNGYGEWTVECRVCHNPHYQKQVRTYGSSSYLYSGLSTGVTINQITKAGAGWTVDAFKDLVVVPNESQVGYNYKVLGNTEDTLTVEGPINLTKVTSGDIFAIVYGKIINEKISLDDITGLSKTGDKTVRFFNNEGLNSFADGDSTYDGMCEACHTQTTHFNNDGTGSDQLHSNMDYPAGTDCTLCHSHTNGFRHGGNETGCGDSSSCHGLRESHTTHLGGAGMQLSLDCSDCHDTLNFPRFNDGQDLSNTIVCNTCHSPGGTYDGVNDATIGVKNNWDDGMYDGSSLKAGKEKWCASCHDEVPSQIFSIDAPNIVGDEDGAYTYGTGWGYYKTGHGLSGQTYPSSGGLVPGAGKTCDNCHDYSMSHIDGLARTFDCSDGCNSTEYSESYRLKLVDGVNIPLTIPRPVLLNGFTRAEDFRLCLQGGCHNSEKFIDYDVITTNFLDSTHDDQYEGGHDPEDPPFNLHAYHLRWNETSRFFPDWQGGTESMTTCITCHNVHGSTQLAMVRNGSLNGKGNGMEIYYNSMGSDDTLNESTVTYMSGPSTANLCETCHISANYPFTRTPLTQEVPTLSWTGEVGYIADGVNPDSGPGGNYFVFRVEYKDNSSEAPKYIQVWVDENDNSIYEEGEKYEMEAVDPTDKDYSDGKLYSKILSIAYAGDGDIKYRFFARDVICEATGSPVSNSTISIANNAPALTWTNEQGYNEDGVKPNSAAVNSSFVFRVKYTDVDNQCPPADSDIQVEVNGTSHNLDLNDGAACDAGRIYYTTITLNSVGSFNYHFNATDGTDTATGDPTSDKVVQVTDSTNPPVLSWTGEAGYESDGVNPDIGAGCIDSEFQVVYSDSDNNPPATIQLWIDENDNSSYEAGEKYDMAQDDPTDMDHSDGKLYTKTLSFANAGDGVLNYKFYASDGSDATGDAPVSGSTLTVAETLEVPAEYSTIQAGIDAASNGDYVCVSDGTYSEQINFSNKAITVKSFNGAASTIIDGSGANTAVVVINSGEGSDSILDGFTIDNQAGNNTQTRGIAISNSSPTIRNSIIQGNASTNNYGGGIYISGGGASIENCVIGTEDHPNTASTAGGISFRDSVTGILTIKDSTIRYNTAAWNGGGLYLNNNTNATVITNTTISNNSVSYRYGGGILAGTAPLSVINSYIDNNYAAWGGAGLYLSTTTATFENSTVSGNTVGFGSGGGIYLTGSNSTLTFNNTTIADNNTNNTFSGGGLLAGGTSQTITFDNSTLSGNKGREGGGIYFSGSDSTLSIRDSEIVSNISFFGPGGGMKAVGGTVTNVVTVERTVIAGNDAQGPGGSGGGVSVSSTADPATTISATFENCMVTGNNSLINGGGFIFGGAGTTANITNSTFSGNAGRSSGAIYNTSAILSVNNSILWGDINKFFAEPYPEIGGSGTTEITNTNIQQDGYEGNGNINVDPLFVDPRDFPLAPTADGDYHLQTESPVIDRAGTSGVLIEDIDDNIRPQAAGIDMGADEVLNVTSSNNVPALLWTGEADYTGDGVDPDSGAGGGSYEFRVSYLDVDNSAPGSIQVWVDENDNGSYDSGEKYDMIEVDAGDTDYTDGKLYTKTLTLTFGGGIINYRFYATDGIDDAIGTPITDSAVGVSNAVPALAWTGEAEYISDGVDPDSASGGSSFEFRIKYTDDNNDVPYSIHLWIDENDNGTYEGYEFYDMIETDSGDTDHTDGKLYTKTVSLSNPADGILNYRFSASDGADEASGAPTSDSTVIVNIAPTLAWTGETNYISDGVDPDSAASGSSFEFRVQYTDADNYAPGTIQVWIDEDDSGTYEPGEKYDMTETDGGDTDYTDGKLYMKTLAITYAGDGGLNYRFYASDGPYDATGTPTSDSTITLE